MFIPIIGEILPGKYIVKFQLTIGKILNKDVYSERKEIINGPDIYSITDTPTAIYALRDIADRLYPMEYMIITINIWDKNNNRKYLKNET